MREDPVLCSKRTKWKWGGAMIAALVAVALASALSGGVPEFIGSEPNASPQRLTGHKPLVGGFMLFPKDIPVFNPPPSVELALPIRESVVNILHRPAAGSAVCHAVACPTGTKNELAWSTHRLRTGQKSALSISAQNDNTMFTVHVDCRRLPSILNGNSDCEKPPVVHVFGQLNSRDGDVSPDLLLPQVLGNVDGILRRFDSSARFFECFLKVDNSKPAYAGCNYGEERHCPLREGVLPELKIVSAGYRARDILFGMLLYFGGIFISYRVARWLAEVRDKHDRD